MPRNLTIVGGGLAGLTLGLALRRRDVDVEIVEAGDYPRHRVCGEFISGRGLNVLQTLGGVGALLSSRGRRVTTAQLFTARRRSPQFELPRPAVGLSRYELDAALAGQFEKQGGKLHRTTRWSGPPEAEGVAWANGRARPTDLSVPAWYGLKAHARSIKLEADLELHFTPTGYVGLCHLADDVVNVCGVFRRTSTSVPKSEAGHDQLRGAEGSLLRARLEGASWIAGSPCAVAGIDLRPKLPSAAGICRVGDALTMVPPFTGNGMSVAFETAMAAAEPLSEYAANRMEWPAACEEVARRCRRLLCRRLGWAGRIDRALHFHRLLALGWGIPIGSQLAWRCCFALTR